jgi:hypothetical protein
MACFRYGHTYDAIKPEKWNLSKDNLTIMGHFATYFLHIKCLIAVMALVRLENKAKTCITSLNGQISNV